MLKCAGIFKNYLKCFFCSPFGPFDTSWVCLIQIDLLRWERNQAKSKICVPMAVHSHLGLCDNLQLLVVQAEVEPWVHNKTLESPLWLLQHKNTALWIWWQDCGLRLVWAMMLLFFHLVSGDWNHKLMLSTWMIERTAATLRKNQNISPLKYLYKAI